MKLLFSFLLSFREKFKGGLSWLYDKTIDPDSGKVKFIKPKDFNKFLMLSLASAAVLAMAFKVLTSKDTDSQDYEKFKKEQFGNSIVSGRNVSDVTLFDSDPFERATDEGLSVGSLYTNNSNTTSGSSKIPSSTECIALIEKVKNNESLNSSEQEILKTCLDNNLAGLSEEDLKMMQMLLDPNVSEAEKALLRKALKGEPLSDLEKALLAKMMDGTMTDEDRALLAKALEDLANGDDSSAKALLDKLNGKNADQKVLSKLMERAFPNKSYLDDPSKASNKVAIAKELADDIKKRQAEIDALRERLANAQADARPIYAKLAEGGMPTKEEQEKLNEVNELQTQLSALDETQERRKNALAIATQSIRDDIANIVVNTKEAIPTGFDVINEDIVSLKSNLPKKLPAKKVAKKEEPKEEPTAEDDFFEDGRLLNIAEHTDQVKTAAEHFTFSDKSIKTIVFPPGWKIPAVLNSEIMVASNGPGQIFEIRVLSDIYDPKSGNLLVPKDAIASGKTGSFNSETGKMELQVTKFSTGAGKVQNLNLLVGSGDGSIGLMGEVRSNQGKYLAGAFITSFSSGVLNWFSQNILQTYEDTRNVNEALIGASLGGGAEVAEKIADYYAEKLKNAPEVFYVPKGVPIVLYPGE